jgi:hypothetical protein
MEKPGFKPINFHLELFLLEFGLPQVQCKN